MCDTINYADSELKKYYQLVTKQKECKIELVIENASDDIFLDRYRINVFRGEGKISGVNARSILLGVYHMFRKLGIVFIRPGKLGEKLVDVAVENFNVNLEYQPSYRHRGITIEGANSLENILDIIEYAPKMGFNSYFIQFRNAYEFFERWYKHKLNSCLNSEEFTEADADIMVKKIIEAIKLRQMIYHAVGHGWTCECYGIASTGWYKTKEVIDENIKCDLALINGERKFFKDTPLNTQLCYSKASVREKLVDEVVNYLKQHREIDVLHFWLADDYNNLCECDECKKLNLSDYYIMMLNEIDEKLTALNINTKICFLVYLELYWTAKQEKIINENRFIMMFAPIFRTYTKPYIDSGKIPLKSECELMEFKLNKIKFPRDPKYYLAFLYKWQEEFKGDCFDFDYHLMWDIYRDFSGQTLSKVLYSDIKALSDMKLDGLVSCQVQRSFYPSALPMYVMGKTLYNKDITYEQIESEFYKNCYGEYSDYAREFFDKISQLVSFPYFRDEIKEDDPKTLNDFRLAIDYLDKFIKEFESKNIDCDPKDVVTESIFELKVLSSYLYELLPIVLLKQELKNSEIIIHKFEVFKNKYDVLEPKLKVVLDGFYLNLIVGGFIENHFEEKLYVSI